MTAKEYLLQIKKLKGSIKRLEETRDNIVVVSGISYDGERVDSTLTPDNVHNIAMKRMEIVRELTRDISRYQAIVPVIVNQINDMDKGEHAELLYLRYVKGMSLFEISEQMSFSYGRIKHMHGEALQEFYKKYKEFIKSN